MKPSYSICIPTLNEARLLGKLLKSLCRQTHLPHAVFIIDGSSTDDTRKIALSYSDQLPVTVITTKPGVGAQRQLGADTVQTQYILFLDADVWLDPHFAEQSLREITHTAVGCACPRYVPDTTSVCIKYIYTFFNAVFWCGQHYYPAGAGSAFWITRSSLRSIGGFTTTILTDDLDCIFRAGKAAGFRQLSTVAHVSDRRFRQDGILSTLATYLYISYLFVTQQLHQTSNIRYTFAHYGKRQERTRSRAK